MKNLKIGFFLLILFICSKSFSQNSEQYYFNKAAKEYYNGNYNTATITLNEGLDVYPSNGRLLYLKKALGSDPKTAEWQKYNQDVANIESQGFQKGPGSNGGQKKSIIDPNGVTCVFYKAMKTSALLLKSAGPTEENKWTNFNIQHKNLINSGYQKGNGDTEDSKKTLQDPDGETHYYFKQKKAAINNIYASFSKNGQNKVKWSDDLRKNSEKITIVFDNRFKKYTDDVTNTNSYSFSSGDKDFDGVECTVTLIIVLKENVKLLDKIKLAPGLKLITHC
jgi:hypothetical protein